MIIHSPIISGSLTFADGSTFTLPDGGNYSGSFSGSIQIAEVQSHLIPDTTEVYDLGSATNRFRDIYLSDATIRLGSGKFGITGGIFQMTNNDDVPMSLGVSSMLLKPVGFPPISLSSVSEGLSVVDSDDEPAPIKTSKITIKSSVDSGNNFVLQSNVGGGVSFLNYNDSACVTYQITNVDLQDNLGYDYTDCNGNPASGTVNANSTSTVQAQEGSLTNFDLDGYRIKLISYEDSTPSPVEVGKLELPIPDGPTFVIDPLPIDPENPAAGGSISFNISGSDTPAEVKTGNIVVSGSNGTSTITNDLPGEGLAVTDSTGSVQPIKVKTVSIVDSETGDVVELSVSSGSLNTTATNSSGSAIADPKSNLSGSFTGSIGLTGDITSEADCVKIGTELNPICDIYATRITGSLSGTVNGINIVDVKSDVDAILSGSAADKDSFAEIVTLINSVDTTNDSVFAGFVTSSNAAQAVQDGRLDTLEADTTISDHIADTNNPHSVTATQVGLGNVTNESKSTMFSSPTFTGTVSGVSKAMVGLGNVDNTSDANKPVSTATQTALDLKADGADLTSHSSRTDNPHGVTKAQVGLGNVDNTSDVNKPISTLTQAALDLKATVSDLNTEKGRIDAILASSDADKDSFAEIVSLINSVDTTNDTAFAGFVTSSNAAQGVQDGRLDSLEAETGSIATAQTLQDSRLDTLENTVSNLSTDYNDLENIPQGIVSSSQQISNYNTFLEINGDNVISSSQQVELVDVTGFNTFSSSISTTFDGLSSNYVDLIGIPADIISGSDQISITSANITDVDAFSQSGIYANLRAQATTKADVGLGSVDNTSDANKPISTATQTALDLKSDGSIVTNHIGDTNNPHGVTAAQVGLGNVTNESKSTMFTSPVFTGPVSAGTSVITDQISITSGGVVRGTLTGDTDGLYLTAPAGKGIGILTDGANDGMIVQSDGSTIIYGSLALENIPENASSDFAVVVGAANTLNYRQLGSNAFSSATNVTTTSAQALSSAANALTFAANTLTLTRGDGSTDTVNLSAYLDDTNLARVISGTYDSGNQELVFTRDDASTFTIDASMFFDDTNLVTTVNGRSGAVTTLLSDYSITATAAEINKLDGVTATTAELNFVDGVTSNIQIQLNGKQASLGFTPYNATNPAGYTTYTSNQATNTTSNVTFASVSATGDVVAYSSSDRRLKDNIVNIENPIEKVQKLNGVTWDWNDNADELQKSIANVGVIAQEVEEVLPQLVKDRENGYKGVDYAKLTGLLIEAVKEQQKQIDELKSRLG